jgi:hypothetical protein
MRCLREAGFSFRAAVHAYSVMDAYIYGFALQEKGLPFDAPEESAQVIQTQRENVPDMDEYPYLVEVAMELANAGYDYAPSSSSGSTSSWTDSNVSAPAPEPRWPAPVRPTWPRPSSAGGAAGKPGGRWGQVWAVRADHWWHRLRPLWTGYPAAGL